MQINIYSTESNFDLFKKLNCYLWTCDIKIREINE